MAEMNTQNKVGITTFLTGLVVFLYQTGEILKNHATWVEFQQPASVGELFIAMAAGIAVIIGAGLTDVGKIFRQLNSKD